MEYKCTVEHTGCWFNVRHNGDEWHIFPTVLNAQYEMELKCIAARQETSSDGRFIVHHEGMEYDVFIVVVGKNDVVVEPLPFNSHDLIKVLTLTLEQIYKENSNMASFNPNDPSIRAIRQRMVPGDKVRDLPQYPADDIKKGQKYAIALPRWISGNCDQQMYDIAIAIKDMKGEGGVVFRPHIMMGDNSKSGKGPLNDIHARTRPIKSESRLLTTWQTEILEIMEANGVPEENIGKVLDLL